MAQAGRWLGVPVTVVMPRTAPAPKRAATEGYGARVVTCEPTLAAREAAVAALIAEHGFTLVHPFDNWNVIAGQGTAALELMEQAGPFDLILCPVGGGGLLAGTALAVKGSAPQTQVVGAEPKAADDALRSFVAGTIQAVGDPQTVAGRFADLAGRAPLRRDPPPRRRHRHRDRARDPRRDALRLGTVQDHHRAQLRRARRPDPRPPDRRQRGLKVGIIITGGNVDLDPMFAALAEKWL